MASAAMTGIPPPARAVPQTFMESVKSWWATGDKEGMLAEERLLRRTLTAFRSAEEPDIPSEVNARISKIELAGSNRWLNMLSIIPPNVAEDAPATVLLHGYGAGLGFYTLNFPFLSQWAQKRGVPVYALDWLGMGRSARTQFRIKADATDIVGRVTETEDFFVQSLEEWREKMKIEKMTLVGHSLGGYLSAVYALRYPSRVQRLVLISPAGVPEIKELETSAPGQELDSGPGSSDETDVEPVPATKGKVEEIKKEQVQGKQNESFGRKMMVYGWEKGWSPFGLLRGLGPWGPMLIGKYSTRRFPTLDPEHVRDFHDYLLNISLAKGSGEYAYSHLLAPGAHARLPLEHRVDKLKIPVAFVYGDHDWMDPEGGVRSVENLQKAGNFKSKTVIIPNAGHHVYLDNAKAVNHLLGKEMDQSIMDARNRA